MGERFYANSINENKVLYWIKIVRERFCVGWNSGKSLCGLGNERIDLRSFV